LPLSCQQKKSPQIMTVKEVMDEMYSSRPDLMDIPLSDPELEVFVDGSSFVQRRQQKAVLTVTTGNDIVQAKALLQGWSAQ
jgi:hypothetical protein